MTECIVPDPYARVVYLYTLPHMDERSATYFRKRVCISSFCLVDFAIVDFTESRVTSWCNVTSQMMTSISRAYSVNNLFEHGDSGDLTMARVYQHSFRAYPNCTLAAIGGCLSAVGDSVAQLTQIIQSKDEDGQHHRQFDMARTMRFFCYGLAMSSVPLFQFLISFFLKNLSLSFRPNNRKVEHLSRTKVPFI